MVVPVVVVSVVVQVAVVIRGGWGEVRESENESERKRE